VEEGKLAGREGVVKPSEERWPWPAVEKPQWDNLPSWAALFNRHDGCGLGSAMFDSGQKFTLTHSFVFCSIPALGSCGANNIRAHSSTVQTRTSLPRHLVCSSTLHFQNFIMGTDYYNLLGVTRDASDEDIKKAYKKMVRINSSLAPHPDLTSPNLRH